MRFIVLALVTCSLVVVAGEPPAASPAKDEKALIIENGKASPGSDGALIIENGKGADASKKAAGPDTGKKALIIQNGKTKAVVKAKK